MKSLLNKSVDIVIVDDDDDDRFLIDYALNKLSPDITVFMVPDARDAFTYLKTCRRQPSLLITDLNMPYLNGLELVNLIKQSSVHRFMPVVVLTTSGAEEDRQRCYQAGANAFLVKPDKLPDMMKLLNSCLQVWIG